MNAGRPKTVLIVEDEARLRQTFGSVLGRAGFSVLEAEDGEAGLASALEHHPDLILLDIILPKLDGLAMLRRLREDEWGKGAQVMLLTNLDASVKIAEAAELGVSDYFVKADWSMDELLRKVSEKLQAGFS